MEKKKEKKIKKSTREKRGDFAHMNLVLCENWNQCQNWHQYEFSHPGANFPALFFFHSSSAPILLLLCS